MPVAKALEALRQASSPMFTVAAANQGQGWIPAKGLELVAWGQVAEMDSGSTRRTCMVAGRACIEQGYPLPHQAAHLTRIQAGDQWFLHSALDIAGRMASVLLAAHVFIRSPANLAPRHTPEA